MPPKDLARFSLPVVPPTTDQPKPTFVRRRPAPVVPMPERRAGERVRPGPAAPMPEVEFVGRWVP